MPGCRSRVRAACPPTWMAGSVMPPGIASQATAVTGLAISAFATRPVRQVPRSEKRAASPASALPALSSLRAPRGPPSRLPGLAGPAGPRQSMAFVARERRYAAISAPCCAVTPPTVEAAARNARRRPTASPYASRVAVPSRATLATPPATTPALIWRAIPKTAAAAAKLVKAAGLKAAKQACASVAVPNR